MNREDAAAAVNNLTAAMINVERLYVAATNPGVRADLALVRQDIKVGLARLRRLQQETTAPVDGGAA